MISRQRQIPLWTAWPLLGLALAALALPPSASAGDAFLGVQLQDLNDALMEAMDLGPDQGGVLLSEVVADSPAEEAGLRPGDILVRLGERDVSNARSLRRALRRSEPGDRIAVEVLRRGESRTFDVVLGDDEDDAAFGDMPFRLRRSDRSSRVAPRIREALTFRSRPLLGVRVEELDEKLGHAFGRDSGLLVLDVTEDGPAERAGLERGDVIFDVAGVSIDDVAELGDVLTDMDEDAETVSVVVLRRGQEQSFEVEIEGGDVAWFGRPSVRSYRAPRSWFHREDDRRHRRGHHDEDSRALEGDLEELREELRELKERLEEMRSGNDG